MKNIIFIAVHGTGKGTQCDLLTEKYKFNHLSTGELIRKAIKKQDDFAKDLEKTINSGKLVSDEVVLDLINGYIATNQSGEGIIFDGFPRTLNQALALDKLLANKKQKIDNVFYLEIAKEEALKRTMGRLICSNCQKSYNKFYDNLKPKQAGICDVCGGKLEQRSDDTEEAFNKLFDTFLEETLPILDYYEDKNILTKIDASMNQEDIFKKVEEKLKEV